MPNTKLRCNYQEFVVINIILIKTNKNVFIQFNKYSNTIISVDKLKEEICVNLSNFVAPSIFSE